MNFNKQQLKAIHSSEGINAINAAAGSGKSSTITAKVDYLVNHYNINAKDIAVISFTSSARENMKEKLKNIGINDVEIHTFHSLSKEIMNSEGCKCSLIENRDIYKLRNLFRKLRKFTNGEIDNILNFIPYQKQYGLSYKDNFVDTEIMISEDDMRECFKIYEDYKIANGKTDYQDWINITIDILKRTKDKYTYKYLMVDEHQDSNKIQNELIRLLCPEKNITFVFDYRQSIFGFSGANPEYCMNLEKEYNNVNIINLDINYRSCNNIVHNANNFIKKYYGEYKYYSDSISNNKNNGKINKITTYSKEEEAEKIVEEIKTLINQGENVNDIGVLYRLNSNADHLVRLLKENKIDFQIKNNGTFFKRKEVDLMICVLRLVENTNDDEAFEKLYSYRAYNLRTFSKKDLERLKEYSGRYNLNLFQSLSAMKFTEFWQQRNINNFISNIEKLRLQKDKSISLSNIIGNVYKLFNMDNYIRDNWEVSKQEERKESLVTLKQFAKGNNLKSFLKFASGENIHINKNKDGIKLMTIHASKGLEFKNVFLIGIEDGKFPHEKSELLEEARLFYVGITRPKENLWLSQIYDDNVFVNQYVS